MFKNRPTQRCGASLIELLVLISVSATLFAIAVVAFTRFLAVRDGGQEHLQRTLQTASLAEQFSRDVWASQTSSQPPGKADRLTLTAHDGRRIEYQIESGTLHRTVFTNDQPQPRQAIQLSGAKPLAFEVQPTKIALLIAPLKPRPVEGEDPHGKPLRIAATLARDLRFQPLEDR